MAATDLLLRQYGEAPFSIALLHGGPGAAGEMAPVARVLGANRGVLEPLQTADTVDGQVEELREVLKQAARQAVVLIGHSWGSWLGFLLAVRHPEWVRKLVLVSSPPFWEEYVPAIQATRWNRLLPAERREMESLLAELGDTTEDRKDEMFAQVGALIARADTFDPLPDTGEVLPVRYTLFQRVWAEAAALRRSGELLRLGTRIRCPVTAIHGDYDPHPAEGVRQPLAGVLGDFHFHLLPNCGHTPWKERQAVDLFYQRLQEELH